jgi:hypothetical protein
LHTQVVAAEVAATLRAAERVGLALVALVEVETGLLERQIAAVVVAEQTIQRHRIAEQTVGLVLSLLLTRTVTQQSLQSAAG